MYPYYCYPIYAFAFVIINLCYFSLNPVADSGARLLPHITVPASQRFRCLLPLLSHPCSGNYYLLSSWFYLFYKIPHLQSLQNGLLF